MGWDGMSQSKLPCKNKSSDGIALKKKDMNFSSHRLMT